MEDMSDKKSRTDECAENVGDTSHSGDAGRAGGAEDTIGMEQAGHKDLLSDKGGKLILPRYDVAFKALFKDENNRDVVADFLRSVLDIPDDEALEDIVVIDPEMLPGAKNEKISILDVLLKIPGQGTVNVEMQLCLIPGMKEKIVYYHAKTAARQLLSGDRYDKFSRVITIVISDVNFINDSDRYHHRYLLYDKDDGSLFTDLLEFDIFEVGKLTPEPDNTARWGWMKFFGSSSDEELHAAAKEREAIGKAMLTIAKLSADEAAWVSAMREEKQRRDYISGMEGAKEEGLAMGEARGRVAGRTEASMENARRMKSDGVDPALIKKYTGLSMVDIAKL
jgi:predicted transposase/invertase (TIGR01784 family)